MPNRRNDLRRSALRKNRWTLQSPCQANRSISIYTMNMNINGHRALKCYSEFVTAVPSGSNSSEDESLKLISVAMNVLKLEAELLPGVYRY